MLHTKRPGFTLMELLLVIGIIGILAGVVAVALRPQSNLLAATDTARKHTADQIQKSIVQYLLDKGSVPHDNEIPVGLAAAKEICRETVAHGTDGCINFDVIVPAYITRIDTDSVEKCLNFAGYKVYKDGSFLQIVSAHAGKDPAADPVDPACTNVAP